MPRLLSKASGQVKSKRIEVGINDSKTKSNGLADERLQRGNADSAVNMVAQQDT
jgi:hypothetical protein